MSSSSASSFAPAATPPLGVTPDFENPRDVLHTASWINTGTCLALVVVFAAVRVYVKLRIKRGRLFLEDYIFLVAWALTIFLACSYFLLTQNGEGYHVWELSQSTFKRFLKWLYISAVVYIPAAYTTKAALLLLTARVFSVKERVSQAIHYLIIGLGVAYLPIQISKVLVCRPVAAYWEITAEVGVTGQNTHCLNQTHLFIADISLAIVTDFVILVLPIPLALSLHALSLKQKLKIVLLLSAGGAATATTVYRAVKIVHFLGSTDPTVDFTVLSIFTLLELTIGLVCACLPALNVLSETLLGKILRHNKTSPNVPRTGRVPRQPRAAAAPTSLAAFSPSSSSAAGSSSWWSRAGSKGTGCTTNTQRTTTGETAVVLDFEAELAIFCGEPARPEHERHGELADGQALSFVGNGARHQLGQGIVPWGDRIWDGRVIREPQRAASCSSPT